MLMLPASSNCAALADWCRVLRHQLAAGVSLKTIGRNLTMSGPASLRLMSGDVQQAIEEGRSIADGLKPYAARLPGIFVPLVAVGEKTGNLPETLSELETYLRQQDQFVREFRKQTMLPKFQLFAAIFIVAGLIYILGQITTNRGTPATPIFGLSGTTGALIFLACTLGPIVAILLWVRRFTGDYRRQAMVQAKLLKLPAIGPCLRALMLSRFALALHLTLNTNLSLARALRLSFSAAGNAAFQSAGDAAIDAVKEGTSLHTALSHVSELPPEFLDMIAIAEEGGTIPEMMKHQSQLYQELARDRLAVVTHLASGGIWALVAIFIIACIFRIASIYIGALS